MAARNLAPRTGCSKQTTYQSGSLGTQFTAALIMMLVEDEALALDVDDHQILARSTRLEEASLTI